MFENIPDNLTDELIDALPDFDREPFYWFAASMVASFYLKRTLFEFKIPGSLELRLTQTGFWWRHASRTLLIGETLFMLRSEPGFPEICRRLRSHDFRSAYFELYATRMFTEAGFAIFARPETGVKGQDFDFRAANNDEAINVEVTALTPEEYSPTTITNALHKKRKQVPDTEPAVIFCALPESWNPKINEMDHAMSEIVRRFFEQTKRIAAIVFLHEEHIDSKDDPSVGYLLVVHNCFVHKYPRMPIRASDLFAKSGESTVLSPPYTQRRESEFFRWVDSIYSDKIEKQQGG